MNPELEQRLIKKYPELFKFHRPLDMAARASFYPICFGVEVGDGWYKILDRLLKKLNAHGGIALTQVKEKWGLLRVYTDTGDDDTERWIDRAELASSKTCEDCGGRGELRNYRGWYYTSCLKHRRK